MTTHLIEPDNTAQRERGKVRGEGGACRYLWSVFPSMSRTATETRGDENDKCMGSMRGKYLKGLTGGGMGMSPIVGSMTMRSRSHRNGFFSALTWRAR